MIFNPVDQSIVAGIDRGLPNVIGLLVLIADMFISQAQGLLTDPGGNPSLQMANQRERNPKKKTFWNDVIRGGQIPAVAGPIDPIEPLGEKFATNLPEKGVQGRLPAATIKIRHGEIDHANIAGDMDGLQGKPSGQKIKLGRNRTDP